MEAGADAGLPASRTDSAAQDLPLPRVDDEGITDALLAQQAPVRFFVVHCTAFPVTPAVLEVARQLIGGNDSRGSDGAHPPPRVCLSFVDTGGGVVHHRLSFESVAVPPDTTTAAALPP